MLNINIDYATDITVVSSEFYNLTGFVVYDLTNDAFGVTENYGTTNSRTFNSGTEAVQSAVSVMVQYLEDEYTEDDIRVSYSGDISGFMRGTRAVPRATLVKWRNQPNQRGRALVV